MNAISKLSSKGQLVVPKSVRDQLGWQASDEIEFVAIPGAVTLRALPRKERGISVEEALARLRAIERPEGLPVTEEQLRTAGAEAAAARYRRLCDQ